MKEVNKMAELNYWELSDEFISEQLTRIHEIMKHSDKIEDIDKIQKIELELLKEQRFRMKTMLDDETEAAKLSFEMSKAKSEEDAEKWKFKINSVFKVAEIVLGILAPAATIYSAKMNFDAKRIECESRERNVDRITRFEENGEIPYQQANKSKFI
jgi:hypothetical protein